jgi:hypothetical protein
MTALTVRLSSGTWHPKRVPEETICKKILQMNDQFASIDANAF